MRVSHRETSLAVANRSANVQFARLWADFEGAVCGPCKGRRDESRFDPLPRPAPLLSFLPINTRLPPPLLSGIRVVGRSSSFPPPVKETVKNKNKKGKTKQPSKWVCFLFYFTLVKEEQKWIHRRKEVGDFYTEEVF